MFTALAVSLTLANPEPAPPPPPMEIARSDEIIVEGHTLTRSDISHTIARIGHSESIGGFDTLSANLFQLSENT